jgi:hypothetical protein
LKSRRRVNSTVGRPNIPLKIMQNNLSQILAQIHADFGIYDTAIFNLASSNNIVRQISSIQELAYLHNFYLDYQREYANHLQNRPSQHSGLRCTNVSRSNDLPFIGDAVIETGQAKYFFVFEGLLSQPNYLSNTVLSCCWLLHQAVIPRTLFDSFWKRRRHAYDYIYQCLGINADIARHSYVMDAVRIGTEAGKQDRSQNRRLLEREIQQLDPELVVLVGKTAADTLGNNSSDRLYRTVPFPTKRRSKEDIEKANEKYAGLRAMVAQQIVGRERRERVS